jgi:probable HAF family extracellular repeat protein
MRRTTMTRLALMALAVSAAGVARPARAGTAYILTDLGTLGGDTSYAYAVNASGQVAGQSSIGRSVYHAFLSGPGGGPLQDLGTLGGSQGVGFAVNDSGQVAGWSFTAAEPVGHAFLSGPGGGALMDLGTLSGGVSVGYAMNDSGQVVGYADTAGGGVVAFLYSGGQMLDLNSLIAPGSGYTLLHAYGISDTGYITGDALTPNGQIHAFLLTPLALVPEPCGRVLLGTGALAPLGYLARRRTRDRA